jgi:2Fe-2S ferredoxin
MPKLTFVEHDGTEHILEVAEGTTVMRAALNNGVPGIMADCGGECACATCHAYLDPAFFAYAGVPGEEERDMLECAIEVRENSRLTCQVVVSDALDGMVVRLPESQI